jgi:ribonuclease VapC
MVIDTSALLAILFEEGTARPLRMAMSSDPVRLMSTMSVLEATCVIAARFGAGAVSELRLFLREFQVEQVPFDKPQLELAQNAWLNYGRGFHAARLNFGDCASYALARFSGEPLLFVGNDFRQTDVTGVSYL